MLKMRFKTGQVSWPERRMSIDPPYHDVASFIYSESGAVAGTTRTIEQLRAVIDGKHLFEPTVNYIVIHKRALRNSQVLELIGMMSEKWKPSAVQKAFEGNSRS